MERCEMRDAETKQLTDFSAADRLGVTSPFQKKAYRLIEAREIGQQRERQVDARHGPMENKSSQFRESLLQGLQQPRPSKCTEPRKPTPCQWSCQEGAIGDKGPVVST